MYFKKLELVGFKSFYNKTTLHFEPGITAVVGPNGCGKSNIFDSIRWVLGEQSAKSMRGSSMEDVIFNGSDSKEQVGMAEVSLTFDNSNKYFPVDQDEVVITRRIFRSGESEYLLNKTQARLKDILDLLMGTGIGAESYSLIPQGKIDLILSSKPEDRRLVFDEASGITKYKAQKKETIRRLEETQQNLLRVNDIVSEVKRQIGSLERQAQKARKYKELFEDLKAQESKLAVAQKKELEIHRIKITGQISESETHATHLNALITEQESRIAQYQIELKSMEDAIFTLKDEIAHLHNFVSRSNERISFNRERITELEINKKQMLLQREQTKERLGIDEEKLNSLKEEYASIRKNIEEKTGILKEKETELTAISSAMKESSDYIAFTKRDILDFVAKIARVKNELSDFVSKEQIYLARKKRLELENAKVNEEKTSVEITSTNLKQEIESLENDFQNSHLKFSATKNSLETENSELNNVSKIIEGLEKEKLSLLSQKQFLEELKTKYEGISESMNAVIYLDKTPVEKISGLVIKIKEYLKVSEEDTKIDKEVSLKISGEAKLFDLDTHNINERILSIEQKTETLKNTKTEKLVYIETLNKILIEQQEVIRNQEITLSNKRTSYQSLLEECNKIKEEGDLISTEVSDVEKELALIREKLNALRIHSAELDKKHKELEESVAGQQNKIALNNTLKEETLVIIAQIKTELDALNERMHSDDDTLKIMDLRLTQDKENLVTIEHQIEENDIKQETLGSEIKELENKIGHTNLERTHRDAALKETENKYQSASNALQDALKKIESDKKGLDTVKDSLYELQMQSKDLEFKYMSIKERLAQAYKIELDLLTDSGENDPEVTDKKLLSTEIEKTKEKLNSYGTVNLVAIEEYDELKKRYDFLTQQHNDLIIAKESLHEAILKINRTTKKMFLETFEKIRIEFRNYFKLLFGGGDAQIYLIDEQDPLESGIEIICRPPGKKLQNVLLLSGGEKSMSAIALIFALFKIKPAPFCVLDEIDAALDEANVDRFSRGLQEFSKISQFIVITHNKKTISNANIMYGITMEESGVSKIVSVKFAQNKISQDKNPDTHPVPEPV